jgi:hypothetical protein
MQVVTATADNSKTISKYIEAMQIEVNSSKKYKDLTVVIITKLSRYCKDKPFSKMKRDDITTYLNSVRKTDAQDNKS